MKKYRVSIYSSIDVEAEDSLKAYEIAHDSIIGCLIKPRDFGFEIEEIEMEETK